jgi:hypothetical protein
MTSQPKVHLVVAWLIYELDAIERFKIDAQDEDNRVFGDLDLPDRLLVAFLLLLGFVVLVGFLSQSF